MDNLLSVVVPTRNRGDISECLRHLFDIRYRPLEIIVIDQSEDDRTEESVSRFLETHSQPDIPFQYHRSETVGLDVSRNEGIRLSKGSWIAFVDDDCLVESGWGEGLVESLGSGSNIGMVFGQTRAYYTKPEEGFRTRISIKDSPDRKIFRSHREIMVRSVGMGGNMSVSRKAIEAAGFFDEHLDHGTRLPGAGDYEMSYRILKSGFHAIYEPKAISLHKRKIPWPNYLMTEQGYSIGRAAALLKHARKGDPIAALALLGEGFKRFAEIGYHLVVTRQSKMIQRAFKRARGYAIGIRKGAKTQWDL